MNNSTSTKKEIDFKNHPGFAKLYSEETIPEVEEVIVEDVDLTILNRLLTLEDWEVFKKKEYVNIFRSFGYTGGEQKDRVMKLSAQLDACDMLGFSIDYKEDRKLSDIPKNPTMKDGSGHPLHDPGASLNPPAGSAFKDKVACDVGCGSSPIALIFAGMGAAVHAITKEPYDVERQHDGVVGHPQITLKTHVDYIKYSEEYFKDSSIDLFLDGCSITHFIHPPTEEICPSDACYFTGKEIARTMKDDGYLIVTSDVSLFEEGVIIGKEKFISMRNMIKSFEAAGLKLFSEVSIHPEFSPDTWRQPNCPIQREVDSLNIKYTPAGIAVARLVFVKK